MKPVNLLLVTSVLGFSTTDLFAADGKELFASHCGGCHYQGGNAVNPAKPLHRLYREANGMHTTTELVSKMRRGGQGMPIYTARDLPEEEARAIAEYITKTFE